MLSFLDFLDFSGEDFGDDFAVEARAPVLADDFSFFLDLVPLVLEEHKAAVC